MTATYHPSALLQGTGPEKEAWEDFKEIKKKLMELGLG